MKTSPSSLKIRQLITLTKEGKLVPRPDFQRRLVWTSTDKAKFIDTILKAYPFPEIYLANGAVNVDTGEGTQLLVDGQQRVTTIVSYFQGDAQIVGSRVSPYSSLTREQKEEFLNYDVAVRDLGSVTPEQIIEVFQRINSTKYDLNEIEINNAVYTGEFKRLAEELAEHQLFYSHKVFRSSDIRRMGDVRFVLQILGTFLSGYFNRDDMLEQCLAEYNEHFPRRDELRSRVLAAMEFIEECGFPEKSRIWKKSDLFTVLAQVDLALQRRRTLLPGDVLHRLTEFFARVDGEGIESGDVSIATYAKAAIQASNDRINRLRRGIIVEAVIEAQSPEGALRRHGLL
jgi:hypothetical protein